jgi:trimeric autotransporter adhesin
MASKSYRKFMATGLSAAVVASVVAPVAGAAASYTDVKEGSWYEEAVNYVTEAGYMQGTGKGFEPESKMTRAQAAQLFTNIFGIADENLTEDFSDVSEKDWFHDAVAAVLEHEIMNGMGNGKFAPEANLTRGQMAAIVVRAYELEDHEGSEHDFSDIDGHMFEKEIAILADLGLIDGVGAGKFAPDAEVTRAQMAQFIYNMDVPPFPAVEAVEAIDATTLEVTVAGAWTQDDVDALIAAGEYELTVEGEESHTVGKVTVKAAEASASEDTTTLVLSEISPELAAGDFYLAVNGFEVAGTEFKYEASATPEVKSVSAIDVNKIKVDFNTSVDTEKAVVKLTKGLANYNITTEWSEDKKSVVITSVLSKLSPADYTVKVEGLTEEVLSADVKIEAETASKVEVATTKTDVVGDTETVTVYFNVLNQYGTKYTLVDAADLTVTTSESIADVSFNAVTEASSSNSSKGNLQGTFTVTDTTGKLKAGDTFKVTAVYKGLTTSSDVTFVAPVELSELSFGQVLPLKDTKRITVGDADLVVPYTAVDQYGAEYDLDLSDVQWVSSNTSVVDVSSLAINSDGELTLDAGNTAGTAIVTAILEDGSTAQFSVTVEAEAYANTVTLGAPTALVADGETASLDLVVYDQFGEVIANKDVTGLNFSNGFSINPKTGKLEGVVTENNSFKVTATRASDLKELASVTFAVEAAAVANTITAVNFDTLYEVGASKAISVNDVVVKDQYGRTFTPATVSLTEVDTANDNFSLVGNTVTADVAGTKVYTVTVDGSSSAVKNITLKAVASADIKSYELAPIGTIYNGGAAYAGTPTLIGKTAEGKTVVLEAGKIASLTSSNSNVAVISGSTVEGNPLFTSATDGTSTIKAWDANGTLLGTAEVTVSNATPSLTTIEDGTVGTTVKTIFDAEDQYGKALDEQGTWYFTSSTDVVTTADSGDLTFDGADMDGFTLASGDYTVKFVSTDGKTVVSSTITLP